MIKLTYKDIYERGLSLAWQKLATCNQFKFPTMYAVSKIESKLQKASKEADALRTKLVDKFAERDEKGEIKVPVPGQVTIVADKRDEFQKEMDQWNAIEVVVDREPLKLTDKDVEAAKLSAADLVALEALVADIQQSTPASA